MADAHDHPRPQLVRSTWTSLDGDWQFAYNDAHTGLWDGWQTATAPFDRTITVPFPPESKASGIGETGPHAYLWYRRTFTVPADHVPGNRLLLHFGAVDYEATVWVNGTQVRKHTGGHVPFTADVTGALVDGEQVLVVHVEDQPDDLSQPRGKQVWAGPPRGILYHRTSGIWQTVWLESVPAIAIDYLRWTSDTTNGAVGLRVQLTTPAPAGWDVHIRLSYGDTPLTDDTFSVSGDEVARTITLPTRFGEHHNSELLWSPSNPRLIDASIELRSDDGAVVDAVKSYTGLRSVGVRNGRFLLNNRPVYLRMALEQGYWPDSHLAATDDELRREVELAKALGFNALRIHQKVENPRFLYWCDRLGLMTWGEMPSAYVFTEQAVTRFTREWTEAIQRDVSHPCLVAWVPTNESWGVPDLENDARQRAYTRLLADLARSLDGTRPVISNDGWEHTDSDILAMHDYADTRDTLIARWADAASVANTIANVTPGSRRMLVEPPRNPDAPVMLTEVGGIGYPNNPEERWHFWSADTTDQLRDKYAELISAILESDTVAGFCYTQLTDTLQERNGLLDAERKPKLPLAELHAITTGASRSVPPR